MLKELGWVFKEGIIGWAVDFLLSAQVRQQYGNKIALIGVVTAKHDRLRDVASGAFYQFLRKHGIDPNVEAGYIAWKYGVDQLVRSADITSRWIARDIVSKQSGYRGRGNKTVFN